jgi:hypothetical protein
MSRRYDRAPLKPEQRPLLDARKPLLKGLASNADDRRDTLTAILRARSRKRPDPFLPIDLSARSPLSSPHLAPIRSSSFRMSAASREGASDSNHLQSDSISSTVRTRSRGVPRSYASSPAVGSASTMSCESAQRNIAVQTRWRFSASRPLPWSAMASKCALQVGSAMASALVNNTLVQLKSGYKIGEVLKSVAVGSPVSGTIHLAR